MTTAGLQPATHMQRVGALSAVPTLLRAQGAEPTDVLAAAGLAPDALADAENRIPYAAAIRLLAECVKRTGCEHFGLLAGAEWRLADLGLVGELARCSATLGEALQTMAVYLRLNNQGAAAYLLQAGSSAELGYAVFLPSGAELSAAYDTVMASACNQVRELIGASWSPREVLLPRSAPGNDMPHRRQFGCAVRFNTDRAALRFPASELRRPLSRADALRKQALQAEAERRMGDQFLVGVYASVRTLLLQASARSGLVAAGLAMHRRTLERRLAEHGTTFRRILEEVRFEVARQLLRDTDRTVTDISAALGYSEPSVFAHAFRRWAGTSPARWRAGAARD